MTSAAFMFLSLWQESSESIRIFLFSKPVDYPRPIIASAPEGESLNVTAGLLGSELKDSIANQFCHLLSDVFFISPDVVQNRSSCLTQLPAVL